MKFLIAGLGSIGRRHLRNLISLGERDILLFRTHHSTLPGDELASFPTQTDLKLALESRPAAVIISNPTALHLDVALPAAEMGCHLFLEKPISDLLDDRVTALMDITSKAGNKVLVGFQFRFHPVLGQLNALITSGIIGRPLSFRVHWGEYLPGWHPWEDYRRGYAARRALGGGVVNTLSHPLDYIRWLFGEVQSLSAVTGHISRLELDNVEDIAEITVRMSNGCIGSIHLDYFQRPPAHWLEVNCEIGHIRWDNDTGAAKIYYIERDEWEQIDPPAGFERNALFFAEMQHFIELIHGEKESRCSLQDGVKALALTEAVHASAQQGCRIDL